MWGAPPHEWELRPYAALYNAVRNAGSIDGRAEWKISTGKTHILNVLRNAEVIAVQKEDLASWYGKRKTWKI
jgi:hypothetical protein